MFLLSSSSSSLLLSLLLSSSSSSSSSSSLYYYHYYYYYYHSVNNIPYQCDINCAGHFISTGPLSDLRYRQVRLDLGFIVRMRARQAPLPPITADCHRVLPAIIVAWEISLFVNICEKIYRIITAPRCMWSSLDLILAHGVLTLPNHCECELFHYSLQHKVTMFTVLPPTQLQRMPFH